MCKDVPGMMPSKPKRSCFWRHSWGQWEQYESGTIYSTTVYEAWSVGSASRRATGSYIRQSRVCENCGKKQLHTVETG